MLLLNGPPKDASTLGSAARDSSVAGTFEGSVAQPLDDEDASSSALSPASLTEGTSALGVSIISSAAPACTAAEDEERMLAEMERMKRATMEACMAEVESHLVRYLQDNRNGTYEEWIASVHPENQQVNPCTGERVIDHRLYVEGSDHRRLWNTRVEPARRVASKQPSSSRAAADTYVTRGLCTAVAPHPPFGPRRPPDRARTLSPTPEFSHRGSMAPAVYLPGTFAAHWPCGRGFQGGEPHFLGPWNVQSSFRPQAGHRAQLLPQQLLLRQGLAAPPLVSRVAWPSACSRSSMHVPVQRTSAPDAPFRCRSEFTRLDGLHTLHLPPSSVILRRPQDHFGVVPSAVQGSQLQCAVLLPNYRTPPVFRGPTTCLRSEEPHERGSLQYSAVRVPAGTVAVGDPLLGRVPFACAGARLLRPTFVRHQC